MVTKRYYLYMLSDTTIHSNEIRHATKSPFLSVSMREGIEIQYKGNVFDLEPYDVITKVRYFG